MAFDRPAYMRKYMADFRQKRRIEAITFLGGKCAHCGSTDDLQFDHINRSTKIKAIGRLHHASNTKFWEEIKKCQILCGNCHRKKSIEAGDVHVAVHGSSGMYKHHKCRCETCRAGNRERHRAWRIQRAALSAKPNIINT